MPTYVLTIAGATKTLRRGSLRITETVNGTNTMTFDVVSTDGSYRPAIGAEVILTEDGTRIFGGNIDVPSERGLRPQGGSQIVTTVSAVDFNALAERRHVNGIIPAGTLKEALEVLVDYAPGVTLDPSQVDGPSIGLLYLPLRLLRDVLDELSTVTGYVWEIDYNKVLRMFAPGSLAAPFSIAPASDSNAIGDIAVEQVRSEYANRIIVLAGSGIREVTESFTGDGSTTEFPLTVGVSGFPSVSENGTPVTVGVNGTDTNYEWTYRASDNTIVQLADAPPGTPNDPLDGGDTLTVTYPGQHPFQAIADDAGEQASQGIWEKVIEEPNVWDIDQAQALADGYLPRYAQTFDQATYETFGLSLKPGQLQTITVSERGLSGDFLITDIETVESGSTTSAYRLKRRVKAIGGSVIPGSWRDLYRRWGGSRAGAGSSTVISVPTTTIASYTPTVLLGGSRDRGKNPNPAAWVPVVDWVPYTSPTTYGGRIRAQVRASSGTVTVRLYNVTDSSVVATGSAVTSTTETDMTPFLVSLTAGKLYRLEMTNSVNGATVHAIGTLEPA